jgi:hypothetical protein
VSQGQSRATIDKERCIASAFAISMKIVNGKFGHSPFTFFHLDTNAGSGFNKDVNVEGSPIVFHRMADLYLPDMKREAFFCDVDEAAMRGLHSRLTDDWNKRSYLFQRDNEEVVQMFDERIRLSRERPEHVLGSVIVDPNGYWYRSKDGIGPPTKALIEFTRRYPKIDIILNLNTRWHRLADGHDWYDGIPPRQVLASLNKKHWLIKRTQYGGNEYLLAVGRNILTGDHRAVGFHHLDSEQGSTWMTIIEGRRQGDLLNDVI